MSLGMSSTRRFASDGAGDSDLIARAAQTARVIAGGGTPNDPLFHCPAAGRVTVCSLCVPPCVGGSKGHGWVVRDPPTASPPVGPSS